MRVHTFLVLAACLLTRSASADAKGWTLAVPPGWSNITDETMKTPQLAAMKRTLVDMGAIVEMTAYGDGRGEHMLLITDIYVASVPSTMSELRAFEREARARAAREGSEGVYNELLTATTLESTQHVAVRIDNTRHETVTRRIAGFETRGGLRALAVLCFGDPTVCDPLVASASVDASSFRTIDSLDAGESWIVRRISSVLAALVLAGTVGFGLLLFLGWRRRKRGSID